MFATAANFLALIAFTVHAVFGCCVHHHHHAFTKTCYVERSSEPCSHEHDSKRYETVAEHRGCSGHGDQNSNYTHSPVTPCDGTDECNEPRCSFIAATMCSLTDIQAHTSIDVCFGDSIPKTGFACRTPFGAQSKFEAEGPPTTSSLRCAIGQSWQF